MLTDDRISLVVCCHCRKITMLTGPSAAMLDADPGLLAGLAPDDAIFVRDIWERKADRTPTQRYPDGRSLCKGCGVGSEGGNYRGDFTARTDRHRAGRTVLEDWQG